MSEKTSPSLSSTLEAIWIKRAKGGPMDPVETARLVTGKGLEGSANQRGKRQVTLISADQWDEVVQELGVDIDPKTRRANLLVRGMRFEGTRGRILRVGDCRIAIRGETRPCRLMEESQPGLLKALDPEWRGGIYGEVLDGGEIALGASVVWEPDEGAAS